MGAVQGTHRKVVCVVALLGGLQPSTSGENETLLSQSSGVGGLFRGAECYTLKRHKLKLTSDKSVVLQEVNDDRQRTAEKLGFTDLLESVKGNGQTDPIIAEIEVKRRASDKRNTNVEELAALLFFKKGVEEPFFLTKGESYTAFRSLFRALWSLANKASQEQDEEKYLRAKDKSNFEELLVDLVNSQLDKLEKAWNRVVPWSSKPTKKVAADLMRVHNFQGENFLLNNFKLIILNNAPKVLNKIPELRYSSHLSLENYRHYLANDDGDTIKSSYEVLNGWANEETIKQQSGGENLGTQMPIHTPSLNCAYFSQGFREFFEKFSRHRG